MKYFSVQSSYKDMMFWRQNRSFLKRQTLSSFLGFALLAAVCFLSFISFVYYAHCPAYDLNFSRSLPPHTQFIVVSRYVCIICSLSNSSVHETSSVLQNIKLELEIGWRMSTIYGFMTEDLWIYVYKTHLMSKILQSNPLHVICLSFWMLIDILNIYTHRIKNDKNL